MTPFAFYWYHIAPLHVISAPDGAESVSKTPCLEFRSAVEAAAPRAGSGEGEVEPPLVAKLRGVIRERAKSPLYEWLSWPSGLALEQAILESDAGEVFVSSKRVVTGPVVGMPQPESTYEPRSGERTIRAHTLLRAIDLFVNALRNDAMRRDRLAATGPELPVGTLRKELEPYLQGASMEEVVPSWLEVYAYRDLSSVATHLLVGDEHDPNRMRLILGLRYTSLPPWKDAAGSEKEREEIAVEPYPCGQFYGS